jgi:hypothetical protein
MEVPHDPGVTSPNPTLRLINISRIARPFGLVSYANYLMLICCGWSGVGVLVNMGKVSSGAELVGVGIALLIYGFSAWVGWKNIGVLEAVVHGYTYPALILLSLFSAGIALVMWPKVVAATEDRTTIAAFATSALIAVVALLALLALTLLICMRIPVLGMSLRGFLKQSLALRQSTVAAHRLPPVDRKKGMLYGALGVGWLVGMQLVPDNLIPDAAERVLWQVAQIGYVWLIYARQYFQPDFATVRAADHRPPVVFLRSFADDEKMSYQKADRALFDFSLESRLAGYFSAVGPFIAVASPQDELPQFGAARAHLTDAEWQGTIMSWLDECSLVILMAGVTEWVEWELKKVVVLSHVCKLIVILPQVKKRFWQSDETSWARVGAVRRAFENTPWEPALAQLLERDQTDRVRSIVFHEGGGVTAVVSRPRNRESYHLAAIIAYYLQQQDCGKILAAAPAGKKRRILVWAAALVVIAVAGLYLLGRNRSKLTSLVSDRLEPLPATIAVTSTGHLQAGNLRFPGHPYSATSAPTYRADDDLKLEYEIAGFGADANGLADLEIATILLSSEGFPASDRQQTRFHEKGAERVQSTFSLKFTKAAHPGEYFLDVKVHDAIANSDLEFRPGLHLVAPQ